MPLVLSCPFKVSEYISACWCVEISCGLLPTRFSLLLQQNCINVKKGNISSSILEKITWIVRKLVKTTYKTFK